MLKADQKVYPWSSTGNIETIDLDPDVNTGKSGETKEAKPVPDEDNLSKKDEEDVISKDPKVDSVETHSYQSDRVKASEIMTQPGILAGKSLWFIVGSWCLVLVILKV